MKAAMEQILVIDNLVEVLSITGRILEHVGYQVFGASVADEGIHTYRLERVSLVISDLKMPQKDGLDVI